MMRILFFLFLGLSLAGCSLFRPSGGETADPFVLTNDETIVVTDIPVERTGHDAATVFARLRPSPNYDVRALPISMIVLHYTAAPLRESLKVLCDGHGSNRVSAHYVVAEDGTIYRLVDESKRAWHAGVARWGEITDVNSASIGIEIVNLGYDRAGKAVPYPKAQIDAVVRLCLNIQSRYDITDVVGHSDVAPARKIDPGELFPWKTLYDSGIRVRTKGYADL